MIGNNPEELVSKPKDKIKKCLPGFTCLCFEYYRIVDFQISEIVIHNSQSRKLLEFTFDNKLKSEKHVNTVFQNDDRKLNALARIKY